MKSIFFIIAAVVLLFSVSVSYAQGLKTISLNPGWNLISISYKSFSVSSTTCDIGKLSFYNNHPIHGWQVVRDFYELDGAKGYWVRSEKSCEIRITASDEVAGENIRLKSGWNQIGSTTNPLSFESVKGRCDDLEFVLSYSPVGNIWTILNLTDNLERHKGYFVKGVNCPPITEVVSVEGYASKPYHDINDNGTTNIFIVGENGMACRMYGSDVDYTAASGEPCVVNGDRAACFVSSTVGGFAYTKHIACENSLGKGQSASENLDVTWNVQDLIPPTGTVTINNGKARTNSPSVALSLTCVDTSGCSHMLISNDNVTYSAPSAYAPTAAWVLDSSNGEKTVYVKYRDVPGNWMVLPTKDTIILDTVPPVLSDGKPTGMTRASDPTLFVETSEQATCRYSTSPADYGSMDPATESAESSSHSWKFTGLPDGPKTYYVKCKDLADNVNPANYQISFTIDTTPPTVTLNVYSPDPETAVSTPTYSGTAADALSNIDSIQYRYKPNSLGWNEWPAGDWRGVGSTTPGLPAQSVSFSFTIPEMDDMMYDIEVRAHDTGSDSWSPTNPTPAAAKDELTMRRYSSLIDSVCVKNFAGAYVCNGDVDVLYGENIELKITVVNTGPTQGWWLVGAEAWRVDNYVAPHLSRDPATRVDVYYNGLDNDGGLSPGTPNGIGSDCYVGPPIDVNNGNIAPFVAREVFCKFPASLFGNPTSDNQRIMFWVHERDLGQDRDNDCGGTSDSAYCGGAFGQFRQCPNGCFGGTWWYDALSTAEPAAVRVNIEYAPHVDPVALVGECRNGQTVTLKCLATDPNQPDRDLTVNVWAGQCNPPDDAACRASLAWITPATTDRVYYANEGMTPPAAANGAPFTKTIAAVNQPVGSAIAATCRATDNAGLVSNWGDSYPLCVVVNTNPLLSSVSTPTSVEILTTMTFSSTATDPDSGSGDMLTLYVCRNSDCNSCGPAGTGNCWGASSASISSNPSATTTCPLPRGANSYWARVCDQNNGCSAILGGSTGMSFTCVDTTPPTGSIVIDDIDDADDEYTKRTDVKLALTCNDHSNCEKMSFSTDGTTYGAEENYAATKTWILSGIDGRQNVYVKYRDTAGNQMVAGVFDSIILDRVAPSFTGSGPTGNIMISPVTLYADTNEQSSCRYSETPSTATDPTAAYNAMAQESAPNKQHSWNLGAIPDGQSRNYYIRCRDMAGNVNTPDLTISFTMDQSPPTGSVAIDDIDDADDEYTKRTTVALLLTCNDPSNCAKVSISNDNANYVESSFSGTSMTMDWTLSSGIDGSRTVYVKYRDTAGNWMNSPVTDTITLDRAAPGKVSILNVEGDTSLPYLDDNGDGHSAILVSGESEMACKWYGSDDGYSDSSGTLCTTTSNQAACLVPLSGETTHERWIACKDRAGNGQTATNNRKVSWNVDDTLPPIVTLDAHSSPTNDNTPTFTGTATDLLTDIDSIQYRYKPSSVPSWSVWTNVGFTPRRDVSFSFTMPELVDNTYDFEVQARDKGSNTYTSASRGLTIKAYSSIILSVCVNDKCDSSNDAEVSGAYIDLVVKVRNTGPTQGWWFVGAEAWRVNDYTIDPHLPTNRDSATRTDAYYNGLDKTGGLAPHTSTRTGAYCYVANDAELATNGERDITCRYPTSLFGPTTGSQRIMFWVHERDLGQDRYNDCGGTSDKAYCGSAYGQCSGGCWGGTWWYDALSKAEPAAVKVKISDGAPPETILISTPPDLTNSRTLTYSGTATDLVTSIRGVQYRYKLSTSSTWGDWTNVGFTPVSGPPPSATFTFSFTMPTDGTWNVEVRSRDDIGNNNWDATPAADTVTVDTTAPEISFISAPTLTSDSTPTYSGKADDTLSNVDDIEYRYRLHPSGAWSAWTNVDAFTPALSLLFSFTMPTLSDNTYNIEVSAHDTGSGQWSPPYSLTVRIDTTPPTISIANVEGVVPPGPYSDTNNDGKTNIVINGESGMACKWYDSDVAYTDLSGNACTPTGSPTTCTISPTTFGSYTKYIACKDSLGNAHTISNNLHVSWEIPNIPPSFTVIPNDGTPKFTLIENNPSVGSGKSDETKSVVMDSSYIYVAGHDSVTGVAQPRIEKRDKTTGALVTAFDGDGVVQSSGVTEIYGFDMAIDPSYIYVAGAYGQTAEGSVWSIEKRDKTTGALVTAFDGDGVVRSNPGSPPPGTPDTETAQAVVVDDSYLYIGGYKSSISGTTITLQWRIEKRDKTTGALVTAFDGDGVVQSTDTGQGFIQDMAVDSSYIYVTGFRHTGSGTEWRIEKRDKTTGALVTAFDGDGVVRSDSGIQYPRGMAIDSDFIYVAGSKDVTGSDSEWRIEKRDKTTGALVTAFDGDGVVQSNPTVGAFGYDSANAIATDENYLYVVGDVIVDYKGGINSELRIEKRDKVSGQLISSFGTNGVFQDNTSPRSSFGKDIAIDSSSIYAVGRLVNPPTGDDQWRIRKIDKTFSNVVPGKFVTFRATATDTEGNQWKLLVCKTNAQSGGSCSGVTWCSSGLVGSGTQAECSYTATVSDITTNAWYAFACDSNNACSPSDSTNSPFYANTFSVSAVSTTSDSSGLWPPQDVTIDAFDENRIFVTYDFSAFAGPFVYDFKLVKSTDGGTTWSTPVSIDPSANIDDYSGLMAADANTVFVTYIAWSGSSYIVKFAKSTDGGVTWPDSNVRTIQTVTPSAFSNIRTTLYAVNPSTIFVTYGDIAANVLKFAKSTDGGDTWSFIRTVDSTPYTTASMSMYALDTNKIFISYQDSTNQKLKFAKSTDGGNTWTNLQLDNVEIAGGGTSIYALDEKRIFISYFSNQEGDLKFIKSTDGGSVWSSPIRVDTVGNVGKYSSVYAKDSHRIYTAYSDETNDDLKFAESADGGNTWTISIVDSFGYTGMRPSMDSTGNKLFIAYYDLTNRILKFANKLSQTIT